LNRTRQWRQRPAEFDLSLPGGAPQLIPLARRAGRIVSREELYAVVWDQPFRKEERSVDVYVRKLRAKLETAVPGWRFIHTHFGFGYRLAPELDLAPAPR
jgi:DNA-binding response OmpR family regulator